jgi:hypothetical protein
MVQRKQPKLRDSNPFRVYLGDKRPENNSLKQDSTCDAADLLQEDESKRLMSKFWREQNTLVISR